METEVAELRAHALENSPCVTLTDSVLYRGYAILTARLDPQTLEPQSWTEVARCESEQAAVKLAHQLRSNSGVARVVDIAELVVLMGRTGP